MTLGQDSITLRTKAGYPLRRTKSRNQLENIRKKTMKTKMIKHFNQIMWGLATIKLAKRSILIILGF